ncbi:MAG: M12 family metallo-peptidase [Bacillota bacterium]
MIGLKRLFSLLMVLALSFVMPLTAFADPAKTVTTLTYEDKAEMTGVTNKDKADKHAGELCTGLELQPLEEDLKADTAPIVPIPDEGDKITAALTIYTCWVKAACDEEWRANYGSSWQTAANNAVETADNNLYTQFGINLYVWTYYSWDSRDDTRVLKYLFNELKDEVLPGNGDTVYGYTWQPVEMSYWGWGDVLGTHVIVRRYGGSETVNWKITRHETGHIYGCQDHTGDAACIMDDPWAYPDSWCGMHWDKMWANRARF